VLLNVHQALAVAAVAAATASFAPRVSARAQSGADQAVTIETSRGRASGVLRTPPAAARPPIVLVATQNAAELSAALAGEGVASLRLDDPQTSEDTFARWIAFLRNDERFPTVTVFGEGAGLAAAVVGARAARADGVVTRGVTGDAAQEIARLVARTTALETGQAAGDPARIAAFARSVPALGRRGTTAARPAAARRSPRHVILSTIGTVRVGIEWGQPQKRGREIWGNLVPWYEITMPGADEATTMTTNGLLVIGSLEVPDGDHTFYVLPAPDRFQLIISNDVGQFHTVRDLSRELGRVDMSLASKSEPVEGLTFALESSGSAGTLKLSWDTREYSVAISTSGRQ
jgi:hypothetical protein